MAKIKNTAKLVDRARRHEEADNLRQGFAFVAQSWRPRDRGAVKGCGVGCLATDPRPSTMRRVADRYSSFAHGAVTPRMDTPRIDMGRKLERDFGIPRALADAVESVFEELSPRRSRTWPRRFAEALVPCEGIVITDSMVSEGLREPEPGDSRPVLAFLARVAAGKTS